MLCDCFKSRPQLEILRHHVDLARHLDRGVVAVLAPAQGPPERVGLLLRARPPELAGLAVRAGTQLALLLHRLGEDWRILLY